MGNNYTVPEIALKKFAESELNDVKNTFYALARKGGGKVIDQKTFLEHFSKPGMDPSWAEALFRSFDVDKTGTIDFEEFLRGMAICVRGLPHEKLAFLFDMYDQDCNGYITVEDLKKMFSSTANSTKNMLKSSVEYAKSNNDVTVLKALYPFKGKGPNELDLQVGDKMTLIKKYNDVWYWVEMNGKKGYVPASYVTVDDNPPLVRTPGTNRVMDFASRMAAKAMEEADLDKDGKLSKVEFIRWGSTNYELSKIMDQMAQYDLKPPPSFVISNPTNFRRVSHIGYNPETGAFEINNLPPEWKSLFQKAGITEKEAADPDTAQYIMSVVANNIGQVVKPRPKSMEFTPAVRQRSSTCPTLPPLQVSEMERPKEPIALPTIPAKKRPTRPAPTPSTITQSPSLNAQSPLPTIQLSSAPSSPATSSSPLTCQVFPPKTQAPTDIQIQSSSAQTLHPPQRRHAKSEPEKLEPEATGSVPPPPPPPPPSNNEQRDIIKALMKSKSSINLGSMDSALRKEIESRPTLRHVDRSELDISRLNEKQLTGLAGLLQKAMRSRRLAMHCDADGDIGSNIANGNHDDNDDDEWV